MVKITGTKQYAKSIANLTLQAFSLEPTTLAGTTISLSLFSHSALQLYKHFGCHTRYDCNKQIVVIQICQLELYLF